VSRISEPSEQDGKILRIRARAYAACTNRPYKAFAVFTSRRDARRWIAERSRQS